MQVLFEYITLCLYLRQIEKEHTLRISMRGYQAATDRKPADIAEEIGESRQNVKNWIKPDVPVEVEYHYDDDQMILDRVYRLEFEIWKREEL